MKFYYFNSTHWDREWYLPMQNFRRNLVKATVKLLDILEKNPEFKKFTFDGQTVVLEDVIEVQADLKDRLKKQISSGRLNVGPWYVMPDEFLVSGEALIRNLLIGGEVAEEYGAKSWKVGYLCDIFGHIAQMPQILKGFNLDLAVIWRGEDSKCGPFFLWESPDKTRCETLKLIPKTGYGDFTLFVTGWWDIDQGEACFKERFQAYVEQVKLYFGENIILSDALDHMDVHSFAPQYLKWIKELYPESEVIHSDYSELSYIFSINHDLPVVHGELIKTADIKTNGGWLIPHTLSSRYDIKAGNDQLQNRLELDIDLIQAGEVAVGRNESTPFWRYAWKQLIKNHAHDSICGCSVDAVHRQMLARFEEVEQINISIEEDMRINDYQMVTQRNIYLDTKNVELESSHKYSDFARDGRYHIRLHNNLPWERSEVLEIELRFPTIEKYPEKWAEPFRYQQINSFKLFDSEGHEIPYKINSILNNQIRPFNRHDYRLYDIYRISFKCSLKASAWNNLAIVPSQLPVRYFISQLTGVSRAENGRIILEINNDGSLNITDKQNLKKYQNLNSFVFDREIGDGWNSVIPVGSQTVLKSNNAQIALVENGPARTIFEITQSYILPEELECRGTIFEAYAGVVESMRKSILTIKCLVTLDADSSAVKLKTCIDNNIKDYRLRLRVPTGIEGEYFAYQNFTFIKRNAGRATGQTTENYPESEPLEKNFSNIVGKSTELSGIAVVGRYGLHEVSGTTFNEGELLITLLRAFRRTVMQNGEPDGQLQKSLTFEYAYKLMDSAEDYAALYRFAQNYRSTIMHYMLPSERLKCDDCASWLSINGNLSLAALKPTQNDAKMSVILRLINLSNVQATGTVKLMHNAKVTLVNLAEIEQQTIHQSANEFITSAKPWQLITYRLDFE